MATVYLRSGASGANNGTSKTDAYTTLAAAITGAGVGGRIYVANDHSELPTSAQTWIFVGTIVAPQEVLCIDFATDALSTGAVIGTGAGSFAVLLQGSFYMYGVSIRQAVGGTSSTIMGLANVSSPTCVQEFERCLLEVANTGASGRISIGTSAGQKPHRVILIDTKVKFAATGQGINLVSADLEWIPGTLGISGIDSTSAAINELFKSIGSSGRGGGLSRLVGVDLSAGATGMDITSATISGATSLMEIHLIGCKMPSSWSGEPLDGTTTEPVARFKLHNCVNGDQNYVMVEQDWTGRIDTDTGIYRSGGAGGSAGYYNGSTEIDGLSWRMIGRATYAPVGLASPEIVQWNDVVGSPITVAVEIVHDSQGSGTGGRLTDKEIGLAVRYLGVSGSPIMLRETSAPSILASATDHPDSSVTWVGTGGMTTPRKQTVEVTFTPEERGFVHAVVRVYAADTVYVCPKIEVS